MTIVNKDRLKPLRGMQIINDTQLDMGKVEALVRDGVWTQTQLDKYGLTVPVQFEVLEGMEKFGEPAYVEDKGGVREVYKVRNLPPKPGPDLRSPLERIAATHGVTVVALLADIKSRMAL